MFSFRTTTRTHNANHALRQAKKSEFGAHCKYRVQRATGRIERAAEQSSCTHNFDHRNFIFYFYVSFSRDG